MAIREKSRRRIERIKQVLRRREQQKLIRVRFKVDVDPLVKKFKALPPDVGKNIFRKATHAAALYLLEEYHLAAPVGETGTLLGAAKVMPRRYRRRAVRYGHDVVINRHVFPKKRYYAVPLEWGWENKPEGHPFIRELIPRSAQQLLRIMQAVVVSELKRREER